jgi:predicted small lipoprotein YifL
VCFLNRFSNHSFLRLAMIGVFAAALGLAACGRKGPLDPPPGASLTGAPQANNTELANPIGTAPIGHDKPSHNALQIGPNGQPMAPKGEKKRIPLDVLLN